MEPLSENNNIELTIDKKIEVYRRAAEHYYPIILAGWLSNIEVCFSSNRNLIKLMIENIKNKHCA
jgi:hypothetical protein